MKSYLHFHLLLDFLWKSCGFYECFKYSSSTFEILAVLHHELQQLLDCIFAVLLDYFGYSNCFFILKWEVIDSSMSFRCRNPLNQEFVLQITIKCSGSPVSCRNRFKLTIQTHNIKPNISFIQLPVQICVAELGADEKWDRIDRRDPWIFDSNCFTTNFQFSCFSHIMKMALIFISIKIAGISGICLCTHHQYALVGLHELVEQDCWHEFRVVDEDYVLLCIGLA